MVDNSALLAHIISQTRQNVDFLMSQELISRSEGEDILAKLPVAGDASILALSQQTQALVVKDNTDFAAPPPGPGFERRNNVPPPPRRPMQARAIWDWTSEDPDDLNFKAGDVIEIVTETNADWWTGRHYGKQGLFPSSYVEKIPRAPSPPSRSYSNDRYSDDSRSPMPYEPKYPSPPVYGMPPPQGPYPPPSGGYQPPPPPQPVGYNPYMPPPPPPDNQAPPQQQPPKKHKFGNLGNTLANSAAGGLGFGAGAAVGSGIIDAIF